MSKIIGFLLLARGVLLAFCSIDAPGGCSDDVSGLLQTKVKVSDLEGEDRFPQNIWNLFDMYVVSDSSMSSFWNMNPLASSPTSYASHASLSSTSAYARGSRLVSGNITAFALLIFMVFALLHLKGLKGGIEEMKENHTNSPLLFWMSMGLLMNLLNKQCTIFLACPILLVIIQMLVTVLLMSWTPLSGVRMEDLWRWCILALVLASAIVSSMFAFTYSSVTCLLILKNCQPILTLLLENLVLAKAPPMSLCILMSLLSIAVGAYMYAHFSPGGSITMHGLGWILINLFAIVIHRVSERHLLTSDIKLSFEVMTLINNAVPLVPLGVLAWATGETQNWHKYLHLTHSPMAIAVITCSGIAGLCLGQSSIMVQACVSATSFSVLQCLTKVLIILAAMLIFHDHFTPLSCFGCVMSLIGCAAYSMAQQAAKQASEEHKQPEATPEKG